jgi:ribosomal protein L7/L12/uncharacterized protein YegL
MTDNILKLSARLDRYELPADLPDSEFNCHVNIVPNIATSDEGELASSASICLVFDCSYSMTGTKFDLALNTANMIVDLLHERHKFSLIAFHSNSNIVIKNAVPAESEKQTIKKQLGTLESYLGGSTNMASGLRRATKVLLEGDGDANIMVILSDGKPNSTAKAQKEANIASEAGIQIFAVGIGDSYNANQLLHLVTPSNGAVFGDSEERKITEIFYDIIHRIDRIIATNVKLYLAFDDLIQLEQAFKISPERSMYDSSSFDGSAEHVELRLGNIGDNRIHEILLKLNGARAIAGEKALIKIKVQYDSYYFGEKTTQDQEVVLTLHYTQEESQTPRASKKLKSAIRSATIVQLGDELMQACARHDEERALNIIDKLQQHCELENNEVLQKQLDNIKNKLQKGGSIDDKDQNDFLLAVTVAAPKAELFDLILVDPGQETIRLVREIRYATQKALREIADMVQRKNSVVTVFKSKSAAQRLQQRLENLGSKVKINAREIEEEDEEDEDEHGLQCY